MSHITKQQALNYLNQLTILQLSELVSELESRWDVSAMTVMTSTQVAPQKQTAPSSFQVILTDFGSHKIKVIKALRDLQDIGLKEAKAIVDNLPHTLATDLSAETAQNMADTLTELGAIAKLEP